MNYTLKHALLGNLRKSNEKSYWFSRENKKSTFIFHTKIKSKTQLNI